MRRRLWNTGDEKFFHWCGVSFLTKSFKHGTEPVTCNVLWMCVLSYLFYDTWHLYMLKKAKCSILPMSLFSSAFWPAKMSWEETYGVPKGNSRLGFTMSCHSETFSFKENKADIDSDSAEDGVMLNGCLYSLYGDGVLVFPGPFSLLCFNCHFTVKFPSCRLYAQFGFLPTFLSGILPVSPNILTLCDPLNDKCNTGLFFSNNVAKFHKKTKSSKE